MECLDNICYAEMEDVLKSDIVDTKYFNELDTKQNNIPTYENWGTNEFLGIHLCEQTDRYYLYGLPDYYSRLTIDKIRELGYINDEGETYNPFSKGFDSYASAMSELLKYLETY